MHRTLHYLVDHPRQLDASIIVTWEMKYSNNVLIICQYIELSIYNFWIFFLKMCETI